MEKLIITAAMTGSRITRDDAPHIPVTPDEIVQSSIECWNAGATIVHIHVRDPKTGLGTQNLDLFRQGTMLFLAGVPRFVPVIFAGPSGGNAKRSLLPGQPLIKYSLSFRCHNNPIVTQVDSIVLDCAK